MTGQAQADFVGSDKYLGHVYTVMRKNDQFLRENAQYVYSEIVDLANDGIDYLGIILDHPTREQECVKRAIFYFLNHVLMPLSSAIWLDALSGNLSICFIEIRSGLESLVKCYLANLLYPNQDFFQERFSLLEAETIDVCGRQEKISISKRMKELGEHLGLEKDFVTLWGKLYERWVHAEGLMYQLIDQVVKKSDVLPWAMIIPNFFTENDLSTLRELREYLVQFRHLLKVTIENYSKQISSNNTRSASL